MRALLLAALVTIAPAEQRFGKRVVLMVDVSSSMAPHYETSIAAAVDVLSQSVDEFEVRVVAFDGNTHWEPGGWRQLPSATAVGEIVEWLRSKRGVLTQIGPTLGAALKEGDVILISDGDTHLDPGGAGALATLVAASKRTVGCIHVGDEDGLPLLRAIAEAGRGGLYKAGGGE